MRKTKGQSLSEYGVVAALVAVVAVPALVAMGGNLNTVMQGMLPIDKAKAVSVAASASAGTGLSSSVQVSGLPGASGTKASASLPASGLNALQYTPDLINTVQTVGVNGATTQLATSLTQLANQLLAAGQIDQANYNDIIALANQGHRLADIESAIISATKAAGDKGGAGYDRSSAMLDGKRYSGPELANMMLTSGTDVSMFQQLMNKVLQSSTIDADSRATISQLSTGILTLASSSATSSDWIQQDGETVNVYHSFTDDLPELITDNSKATKKNANGICNAQSNSAACNR